MSRASGRDLAGPAEEAQGRREFIKGQWRRANGRGAAHSKFHSLTLALISFVSSQSSVARFAFSRNVYQCLYLCLLPRLPTYRLAYLHAHKSPSSYDGHFKCAWINQKRTLRLRRTRDASASIDGHAALAGVKQLPSFIAADTNFRHT
eukprot:6192767-Pleurochrysis_carterae.AAC.2